MAEGKRLALLIGNQRFAEGSGFAPLRGPHNDVDALAAVLADPARGGFDVAPPLKDASRSAMLDAIEAVLKRAGREDTVLIHYSGHGKPDARGRLHFAAADSHAERLRTTALRAAELHEMASESACRAIILLLDCCYSGAIGEAMQGGLRGDVADQAQQELRRTVRDATGLFILTSSTGWQTSDEVEREVDGRVMGRFTRAVLDRLEAPPPPGRAGEIRFSHLAEHVEGAFPGQDARRFQVDAAGDPLIARAPLRETEAERREKRLAGWVRDGKVPEFVYAPCFEAVHGSGAPALVTLVARLLDAPGMTPGAFAAAVRDALPGDVPPVWGFNEALAPAPAPVRAPPMPPPMPAAPPSRRRFLLALVLVVPLAVLGVGFGPDVFRQVAPPSDSDKVAVAPPAAPLQRPADRVAVVLNPLFVEPNEAPPIGPRELAEAQRLLASFGLYAGPADGVMGPVALAALQLYRRIVAIPGNGLTPDLLERLRGPAPDAGAVVAARQAEAAALWDAGSRQDAMRALQAVLESTPGDASGWLGLGDWKRDLADVAGALAAYGRARQAGATEVEARVATLAGKTFRDCPQCPEMVVIPAGRFTMGSPPGETDSGTDERPQRVVTVPAFAAGRTEVTFAQWDACLAAARCDGYKPDDRGWGRETRPVIYVGWADAQKFVAWLSEQTSQRYRLLTEAEWEYAARAPRDERDVTPFATGPRITPEQAQFNWTVSYGGSPIRSPAPDRTAPVGQFPSNRFGLFDMHGNVWEWVQDAYGPYPDRPTDASDLERSDNGRRVLRGGSWGGNPRLLRSAQRFWYSPGLRNDFAGFRVARTLF